MPHMAPARYRPDELAFMAAMTKGTDELRSGVTVDAPSDEELEEIEGEAESDPKEIIPLTTGNESIPGEEGTRKRKSDGMHDELPSLPGSAVSVSFSTQGKSNRKKSKRELNKSRPTTDLILEQEAWIEAEAQKPFCKNKFGPRVLKCSCHHVLRNPTLRLPVAKFCVEDVDSKSKTEVDQRVCDWFGYAKLFQKTSKLR